MKKQLFSVLALVALMGVFSFSLASAQDDELPACDPMDLMTNMEDMMAPLTDMGEMMSPDGTSASEYTALVIEIDEYVTEFWAEFDEAEFECAEEEYFAYSLGLTLDELLIVMELSTLAIHESEAGDTDAAALFSELATTRSEALSEDMLAFTQLITDMMTGEAEIGADLDECSEEDLVATTEGIGEINEAYIELGAAMDGASGEDLTDVVEGMATLSTEYWTEFFPEVAECAETQEIAMGYGLILDESLIMVGLIRLAEFEAEAGNDELAETLAESATARAESLEAMAEELFGESEE